MAFKRCCRCNFCSCTPALWWRRNDTAPGKTQCAYVNMPVAVVSHTLIHMNLALPCLVKEKQTTALVFFPSRLFYGSFCYGLISCIKTSLRMANHCLDILILLETSVLTVLLLQNDTLEKRELNKFAPSSTWNDNDEVSVSYYHCNTASRGASTQGTTRLTLLPVNQTGTSNSVQAQDRSQPPQLPPIF